VLHLRADLLTATDLRELARPAGLTDATEPARGEDSLVELAPGSSTDVYCFAPPASPERNGEGDDGAGVAAGVAPASTEPPAPPTGLVTAPLDLPDVEGTVAEPEDDNDGKPARVLRFRLAQGDWAWSPAVHVDAQGDTHFFLSPSSASSGRISAAHGAPRHSPAKCALAHDTLPAARRLPLSPQARRRCAPLLRVSIVARGCTLFIAVSDASACPPYRIENRSVRTPLYVRPKGSRPDSSTPLLAELRPMSWVNIAPTGTAADAGRAVLTDEVFSVCLGTTPRGGAWREYSLQNVKHLKALELSAGFARTRLYVMVQLVERCRVLVLSDSPLALVADEIVRPQWPRPQPRLAPTAPHLAPAHPGTRLLTPQPFCGADCDPDAAAAA